MSTAIGFAIEGLVAALLMITIGYCLMLNRRLARLKADEQTLKATISELITATEIAERAIAGLKTTVHECDQSLGKRLKLAETMSADIARQIAAGDDLIGKLAQIAGVSVPSQAAPPPIVSAQATATAAQAFAARVRLRTQGAAA